MVHHAYGARNEEDTGILTCLPEVATQAVFEQIFHITFFISHLSRFTFEVQLGLVEYLHLDPLSFTPGFSQVTRACQSIRKPFKRFPAFCGNSITWLKPGVNERNRNRYVHLVALQS